MPAPQAVPFTAELPVSSQVELPALQCWSPVWHGLAGVQLAPASQAVAPSFVVTSPPESVSPPEPLPEPELDESDPELEPDVPSLPELASDATP
jgi:hypothetical protein